MRNIHFTKMQGLGNDFVVVEGPLGLAPEEVSALCDRRFGVGADGILVVTRDDPIRMEYYNADGSAAEMCGNGLRCVARYAYDRGWASDPNFAIQTPVGARAVRIMEDIIEVELGRVEVTGTAVIGDFEFHLVSVGNPHAVVFVEDPGDIDVEAVGRSVQDEFPGGINVEFASVVGSVITMRIWERGVGETLACGTGMSAAVAAAQTSGEIVGRVEVDVPGGRASVEIREGVAWLRGPAEYSFRGSVGAR